MSPSKQKFENTLLANVVKTEQCVGCGACVTVCPHNCLDYVNARPILNRECEGCGTCARVCPRYESARARLERHVFGLEQAPRSEFGVYRKLVLARAADEYVRGVAQDGGAVSALLLFALAEGIVDSAIVSGLSHKKPFYPEPKVVKRAEEVLEAAGTRYTGSPNLLPLGQALRRKRKVAFVGTPCQIHAARKIQAANVIGGSTSLKLLIGLMCSERFTYEGLMEKHLQNEIGVELSKIRKINIKGKMEVTTDVGITEIPLADIKQYVEKGCIDCKEFSSELADISVGGLGMKKWTFIIARTEKGEKLLEAAEKSGYLETKIADLDSCEVKLLVRLSRKKARPIRSISGKDTPNSYQREKH